MLSATELKATRRSLIREHNEALTHIDALIALFEKREGTPLNGAVASPSKASPKVVELSQFENDILAVAAQLPAEDITSPKIYDALTAKKIEIGGADRDAKINTITNLLYKLVAKEKIKVSVQGRGRRATVYALS